MAYDKNAKIDKDEERLKERIGDLAYLVTQRGGTEAPFSGEYERHFEKGIYVDIISGEPLFSSLDKFPSACGWPSFAKPIDEEVVTMQDDRSFGMLRTEVRSSHADSHLGHVFGDGPIELGGLRYCINSVALRFVPYDKMEEEGYGEFKALFDEVRDK